MYLSYTVEILISISIDVYDVIALLCVLAVETCQPIHWLDKL